MYNIDGDSGEELELIYESFFAAHIRLGCILKTSRDILNLISSWPKRCIKRKASIVNSIFLWRRVSNFFFFFIFLFFASACISLSLSLSFSLCPSRSFFLSLFFWFTLSRFVPQSVVLQRLRAPSLFPQLLAYSDLVQKSQG